MTTKRMGTALVALALVLGACGDHDDTAETGDAPTTTAAEDGGDATTTTAADGGGDVVDLEVTAVDYGYEMADSPLTLEPGLVRISLTNTGAEEHQATIVRLNDGVTPEDLGEAAAGDPTGAAALALVQPFGGPNGAAPGGGTSVATADLVAGDYLMLCFIPSPSDNVPHSAKGMVLPFTVEGESAGETALPEEDLAGEIGLQEFGFDVPEGFDGQGTYAIGNDGEQPHEVAIYSLADGATLDDVLGFFAAPTGPPPFAPAAGIAALAGLRSSDAYIELDLGPGEYVFLCFLPDTSSDGAPHFTKGMAQQVTIG